MMYKVFVPHSVKAMQNNLNPIKLPGSLVKKVRSLSAMFHLVLMVVFNLVIYYGYVKRNADHLTGVVSSICVNSDLHVVKAWHAGVGMLLVSKTPSYYSSDEQLYKIDPDHMADLTYTVPDVDVMRVLLSSSSSEVGS